MKLLTLNIRHGGANRISEILDYLGKQNADLICLTEFRLGARGQELCISLENLGYHFRDIADATGTENTVAIFSKRELEPSKIKIPSEFGRHIVSVTCEGILIFGAYFPQGQAKAPVFDWLLKGSSAWLRRPSIILGDMNTGLHHVDETGATFACAEQFQALLDLGWRDSYRKFHGAKKTFTWFSNKGNGFRVDHAFVTQGLKVADVDYDDSTRSSGITDHSSMKITLA